ncbi:putative inactive ATP-dependent zinc metalloprotease FTSHI 5 [Forsythia ovata]|uniref:Inactive ATP-dependent zinc metalloprotease FTSHI 5 n=1 Tax=Forsythia ovata TaxID=205694 RepID=A0ABD1TAK7_9LAMI
MNTTVISPHQTVLFAFPVHHSKPKPKVKTKPKTTRFGNFSFSVKCFSNSKPRCPLRIVQSSAINKINKIESQQRIIPPIFNQCNEKNALDITKPVVYALFCIVFGLFCPVSGFRQPAFAAVATPSAVVRGLFGRKTKGAETKEKGHKYSHCTRKLLEIVARLLKTIEEGQKLLVKRILKMSRLR